MLNGQKGMGESLPLKRFKKVLNVLKENKGLKGEDPCPLKRRIWFTGVKGEGCVVVIRNDSQ